MNLVTGGTGHLGSHILFELVMENRPVRALYRNKENLNRTKEIFSFYKDGETAFEHIEWVEADINDYYAVAGSFKDVSHVFHTAGYVTFDDKQNKKLHHVNAEGTANIVNACLESENVKLYHVSSIATLGEPGGEMVIDEGTLWNHGKSASAYAKSKYMGEMEVWRGIHEGLHAVIVNPSVIIGPGMWLGPGTSLWQSVLKGLRFYPVGSSGYVDVRDVASILVRLSKTDISGERFILNAGQLTHKEFLSALATGLHKRAPYIRATPFLTKTALLGETLRASITHTKRRFNRRTIIIANKNLNYSGKKVRELLNFKFIPVEESVKMAVEIYNRQVLKKK